MRSWSLAALLVVILSVGAARADALWGVKLTLDVPADPSIAAFVADPLGYALTSRDVLDVRAFLEVDELGFEARWRSATELHVGAYYLLGYGQLFEQAAESTIGLYVGRDARSGGWIASLRGTILVYGHIPLGGGDDVPAPQ